MCVVTSVFAAWTLVVLHLVSYCGEFQGAGTLE